MIYPHNIVNEIQNAKGLHGKSKRQVYTLATLVSLIVAYFAVQYIIVSFFDAPTWVANVAYIVLVASVGIAIFRFGVVKEDERMKEHKESSGSSYAKFLSIRKDVEDFVEIGAGETVPILEYNNTTAFAILNFKFGDNNDAKAEQTKQYLKSIIHMIASESLEYRFYTTKENIMDSNEYKQYIDQLNMTKDRELAKTLMRIADTTFRKSAQESNVDEIYLILHAKNTLQRLDFDSVLKYVVSQSRIYAHAFRSIKVLNKDEVFEFVKKIDNMEVLDFAILKAILSVENEEDQDFNMAELYALESEDAEFRLVQTDIKKQIKFQERKISV